MNPQESDEAQTVDRIPARTLLEGLARVYDLVLVTDHDGRVLWMSNGLLERCGGAEFRVGLDAQAIIPQIPPLPKPDQVFSLRSRLRRQGYLSNVKVDLPSKCGDPIPVEVNMMPVSTPLDERSFFVVIARPLADDPPRGESTPAAQPILDDVPDALLAIDARGFVSYANPAVERLLGHAPELIVDTPVAALLSNADDLERLVASLGEQGELGEWDLSVLGSDGTPVQVAAAARARRDGAGSFTGTVLSLRDVTERRRQRDAIERKNAELEHCVNALAHDLRSPLVALLGFSRLLRQDYEGQLDDTGMHFIDRIEQAGRTMEDLIHDLLELSRIGQPGERKALVDPRTVLTQLQAEFKPRLDAGGIRLEIPVEAPLIYCDRTRLYQVFSNLIGNALDHMGPCDDPFVRVTVTPEPECDHITVSDPGRGVAEEHRERVFDVFQSLGPATDGRRGTGIGLAVVKKIADTHGGRVWLDNREGGGAEFHITFPRT